MDIRLISFSGQGCQTAAKILRKLSSISEKEFSCTAYALEKHIKDSNATNTKVIEISLDEWTKEGFAEADALIFVCACGIAVRAISPYVKHKSKDPAVIVVDERGQYAIPILSGHLGGANRLAQRIAELIDAEAVLTTATDINKKFAVDSFAKDNELYITDMKKAKDISSAILSGEKIGLVCDYPIEGKLPPELSLITYNNDIENEIYKNHIYIGRNTEDRENCLNLVPKLYILGVGCRRGKSCRSIKEAVVEATDDASIVVSDISLLASIDLKKDEKGIKELCKELGIESRFYSSKELEEVKGNFDSSEFVRQTTGVDNVCERAAVAAGGEIILHKRCRDGVTVALARKKEKELKIRFE